MSFNFSEWWGRYVDVYKTGKQLFHNQLGGIDGPWLQKLKKDLSRPDLYDDQLYERNKDKKPIEVNCNEALERLKTDIKVKKKQQRDGQNKTVWQLPLLSVYVGQGERGRRYTWDIAPMVSDEPVSKNETRCKCGKPTFNGRQCGLCWSLEYSDWEMLIKMRDSLGLEKKPGESKQDRKKRCMDVAANKLGFTGIDSLSKFVKR